MLLYHDFASPFCRLAARLAPEAGRRTGTAVRAVPFELWPAPTSIPPSGGALEDELEAARAAAQEWGIELGGPPVAARTRKAHEAVAFARRHGAELDLLEAIYAAAWEKGKDISRIDVLADTGEAVGLDREALHVALGLDELEGEVAREQEAAVAAGLTGVPAFQVQDIVAVGLLPLEELVEWVERHR